MIAAHCQASIPKNQILFGSQSAREKLGQTRDWNAPSALLEARSSKDAHPQPGQQSCRHPLSGAHAQKPLEVDDRP